MSVVGSDILRVTGILKFKGQAQPTLVHGVQHIFHQPVFLTGSRAAKAPA
jgi:hypothetical protein